MKFVILFYFICLGCSLYAQEQDVRRILSNEEALEFIDSLRNRYGYNKEIPDEIQLPALVALSAYPELAETCIVFRYKKIRTTMSALPGEGLLAGRNNRVYVININEQAKKSGTLQFDELSFNARVGVIGHELAHIEFYTKSSGVKLFLVGLGYLLPFYKKKFERTADQTTIYAGLGWQLYDFDKYLFDSEHVGVKYLKRKRKFYLSPEEIYDLVLISQLSF